MSLKKGNEVATIDVVLVTLTTSGANPTEIGLTTSNKVAVEPSTETTDAVKNIVKGVLIAQKPAQVTITGNAITLTDNVFNSELVKILQGGTIKYWADSAHTAKSDTDMGYGVAHYAPPTVGSGQKGQIFQLSTYSAIYNAAGLITGYEKCTYPNCQGQPIAFSSEDGTFRAPEYTINSAPDKDESPYEIDYVDELPALGRATVTQNLTNATSTFSGDSVTLGDSFTATLAASAGYTLDAPTIMMDGADVTASVYNTTTGVITINRVVGNIVITATATEE